MRDDHAQRPSSVRWAAVLAAALTVATPGQARAQGDGDADAPRILATAWSAFSIREGQRTIRFADDMVEIGGRVSLNRDAAPRPWVQVDYFRRPDLSCVDETLPCNSDGFVLRGGLTLPLSDEEFRTRGVHSRLFAGLGAGFSEETELAYLFGFGVAWTLHPRLAPVSEVRWESVPGLRSVVMLAAGLRLGIL